MNIQLILITLQLAMSLLVNVSTSPTATADQKQQAIAFANQAISKAVLVVAEMKASNSQTSQSPESQSKNAPVTQPTSTVIGPVPSEISAQNQICNLAQTNLKSEYVLEDLLQNGNIDGRIFMNAYVLDQHGKNYFTDNPAPVMTITTSNHSNDKVLNGSGNTGPCGYFYPYELYVMEKGTYVVTYDVLGLTKSVEIKIK
jgi:type II secretory pathway pseudopilin PulG